MFYLLPGSLLVLTSGFGRSTSILGREDSLCSWCEEHVILWNWIIGIPPLTFAIGLYSGREEEDIWEDAKLDMKEVALGCKFSHLVQRFVVGEAGVGELFG